MPDRNLQLAFAAMSVAATSFAVDSILTHRKLRKAVKSFVVTFEMNDLLIAELQAAGTKMEYIAEVFDRNGYELDEFDRIALTNL